MQSSGIKDEKLLSIIKQSEDRVQSMSLVHEKLYQSDLMATIDFTEYLGSLAERLISSYSVYDNLTLKLDTEPLMLSINTAIPCGLIINEILTNSIKYAFPRKSKGEIQIKLRIKEGIIILKISDNGIGLPKDYDPKKMESLGMKLILILTEQIDGVIEITSEKGTSYSLTFSEREEREE
jgi:two-component sensor histidine kinase